MWYACFLIFFFFPFFIFRGGNRMAIGVNPLVPKIKILARIEKTNSYLRGNISKFAHRNLARIKILLKFSSFSEICNSRAAPLSAPTFLEQNPAYSLCDLSI